MKYIPEEHVLIDYLYNKLDSEQKIKVEEYLGEHPEVKEDLLRMNEAREVLGKYPDKEVIVPAMFDKVTKGQSRQIHMPYLRTVVGVAASLIIILLVGYITDLKIDFSKGQMTIAFGEKIQEDQAAKNAIDYDTIESFIRKAVVESRQFEEQKYAELKSELLMAMEKSENSRSERLQSQISEFVASEKQQIRQYASNIEAGNANAINQHFANNSLKQQAYMEGLLIDFTKYMDEQRLQDKQFYITHLVDMKYDSELKQQETEELLTSIIKKVNNLPNEGATQNF